MAGLRSVGTCDLEPLLDIGPLTALPDVARFTSLFGGNCVGLTAEFDRNGAAEPLEKVREGESGPTLDLGLLFCDMGIIDSRLIHEPFDETESLLFSSPLCSRGDDKSPFRTIESLLPLILPLLSIREIGGRWCMIGGSVDGEEPRDGRNCLLSGVMTVELVPGRDIGDERS